MTNNKKNLVALSISKAETRIILDEEKIDSDSDKEFERDISDTDFVLSFSQYEKLKLVSEAIFKLANETLLDTIKQRDLEPWIEARYGTVKSLWHNGKTGINFMRIDYAWDQEGNFKALELNVASQGGWIIDVPIKEEETSLEQKRGIYLTPDSFSYTQYLIKKLGLKIAIIVKTDYNKESNLLLKYIKDLGGQGKIIYLSKTIVEDLMVFAPTGLFWRSGSALVDQAELALQVAKLGLPQIPSFEALFIAGDKSFLALLHDKDVTGAIPKTYVLSKKNLSANFNLLPKDKAVLKPGDLARGEGVKFGKYYDESAWRKEIEVATNSSREWVIQELCYLRNTKDGKYQDITIFLADGIVKGSEARISASEVINIAKGGVLQLVVYAPPASITDNSHEVELNDMQTQIEVPPKK